MSASIQPHVSPTSVTRSDLPRVEPAEPLHDWLDDEEPITDVIRLSDAGEPRSIPTARDRAVLIRMDGAHAGQLLSLSRDECTIGRNAGCNLAIADAGVSRFHARIVHDGSGHTIEDMGSRNGTFVRGQRITREALVDGDWVQLGPRASFRYSVTDSRQEHLLKQLYESSTKDALTGAYNRQFFQDRLKAEIAYAVRHRSSVALVIFDIDHFKRVNDTFGHLAGDHVLKHVARLAARQLRAEDVFARYGGEEFAVLLRGIDLLGSMRVAERLRATLEVLPAGFDGQVIPVTISAGCAALGQCSEAEPDALVALADARLYAAKRAGRNRIVSYG